MAKIKSINKDFFIGFDLDGVIINHAPVKMKLAKKYGFILKPEETPSEIVRTIIDRRVYDDFQWDLYDNPRIFKTAPLMTGANTGLNKLKKNGLPFALISRRRDPESAISIMKHHGLWPKFFNKNNAFFVSEKEDKNIKAKELGVTHYIDDEIDVLEKLGDVKNKFLLDCFNAFKHNKNYVKVSSWKEFLKYFI